MAHDGIPHHWIIEPANGCYSWSTCQVSGCEEPPRRFDNIVKHDEYQERQWGNKLTPASQRPEESDDGTPDCS